MVSCQPLQEWSCYSFKLLHTQGLGLGIDDQPEDVFQEMDTLCFFCHCESADVCVKRGAGYVKGEAVNNPAGFERCRAGARRRVPELDSVIGRRRCERLCVV